MKVPAFPCLATLVRWNEDDGVGVLRTEAGDDFKCGRSVLRSLRTSATVGNRFIVEAVVKVPVVGIRATRVTDATKTSVSSARGDEDEEDHDEDEDEDDGIPTDSLESAISWLEKKKLTKRPAKGASKVAIAAFEERTGVKLPAGYRQFLQTHGYLDGRVHVFGLAKTKPDHDIEAQLKGLQVHIESSIGSLDGTEAHAADWRKNAARMRTLTPIMAFGNPLCYATGILIDVKGRYYGVDVRGFVNQDSFRPEPKNTDFDELLLRELAGWYADD